MHAAYGEPLAVLAGDALIVMAFDVLADAGAAAPHRLPALLRAITRGVGAPTGIVAGQAWESEPFTPVEPYHQAKTGALFVAAVTAGAIAAGADPTPWRAVGENLGAAYQVADDLADAVCQDGACGKPARAATRRCNRPNLVHRLGLQGAYARLDTLVARAAAAVPECAGAKRAARPRADAGDEADAPARSVERGVSPRNGERSDRPSAPPSPRRRRA